MIEFTHRVTSGITLPLVIFLVWCAWRVFPKGSLIRRGAFMGLFFTITEALVGAGLVLFRLVEYNDSVARALSMVVHLVNTFLLTGSLALTAWWSTAGEPDVLRLRGISGVLMLTGVVAILVLGASGAVTALGDTLFPATSLSEALQDDFSSTAHYLIQLRVYHPAIAVSVGVYLFFATAWIRRRFNSNRMESTTTVLFALYVLQIVIGAVNVALLAPVWMQIVHLFVTNLIWVTFVLLASQVFRNFPEGLVHQPVDQPV